MKLKVLAILFLLLSFLTGCESMVVFDPQGPVAKNLTDLIIFSIILMAIVVAVVFILYTVIIWKYRERPENKDYEPPHEAGNKILETTWFVIPIIIVIVLTIPTIKAIYDHEEIPEGYQDEEPLVIHVTSADWKWIFTYPEQDIETVNYLNIPEDRPIQFKMTSTGTMQSFWIPSLGGQKYTMANMETNLFLVADRPGSYIGRNTNFNGKGYAHMDFEAEAMTHQDFVEWVEEVKNSAPELTKERYLQLVNPTIIGRETYNGTHLQWIDHSDHDAPLLTDPEDYRIGHGDEEEHGSDENEVDTSKLDLDSTTNKHEGGGH
ncbi:cytochrome aa3 quinol oxidase subunit II [Bacillaceae bacterium S4-13-56]